MVEMCKRLGEVVISTISVFRQLAHATRQKTDYSNEIREENKQHVCCKYIMCLSRVEVSNILVSGNIFCGWKRLIARTLRTAGVLPAEGLFSAENVMMGTPVITDRTRHLNISSA